MLHGNEIVGEVTSGTFSPTFERPIAMAYVRPTAQAVGTRLAVDIRGTQHAGRRRAAAVLRTRKEELTTEDTENTEKM